MWIQLIRPAPLLNTPNFEQMFGGTSGASLHSEFLESVALPGMTFPVLRELGHILEVVWESYAPRPLYIDRRFGKLLAEEPRPVQRDLPSAQTLLQRMEKRLGASYVWGGNWGDGIPELLEYYPPAHPIDTKMRQLWTLQGVDCSGLLFEASGGLTPRNTSHLLQFGHPLEPGTPFEPLDMLLYPGHVLFIRDSHQIIESKSPMGVRLYPLEQRLAEIAQENRPLTIRRFAKKQ